MSKRLSPDPKTKADAKREAVLGGAPRSKRKPLLVSLSVAAVLFVAGFLLAGRNGGEAVSASPAATSASGSEVTFPVGQFQDGKAQFYKLDANGITVRYYAVKGSDGVIHTAYDACDACWHSGKGYKQAGDVMVCQNCNRKFAINEIGQIHGGCNPAPLKNEVRDGKLIIRVAEIQAGRHYFDLPKGG